MNFVKKLKQWIKTRGQDYKSKSKRPTSTQKSSPHKPTKKSQKLAKNQDIFDKLRMKNDNSPVNSVLMRDNPSPIHLFEKLKEPEVPLEEPAQMKLLKAMESFTDSLKLLKVKRSVIRESINKFIWTKRIFYYYLYYFIF